MPVLFIGRRPYKNKILLNKMKRCFKNFVTRIGFYEIVVWLVKLFE